ncbi:TrlF family AAA-like ATPase [Testudinibacter sp. P27/CKL/0425]
MNKREQQRGSIWRQWDLHIHTPASFHWNGDKFNGNNTHDNQLIDEMINALNQAEPAVFAIMDYWTFDGWFKLQARLKDSDAPALNKVVFPGIELRLAAPMKGRLNAHVIFSNKIEDQVLLDFQSALKVELVNRPLSASALKELAREHVGEDKLKKHGFDKQKVACEESALLAGSIIAEINPDSYKDAIAKVPNGYAVGFMPWDTNDGLAEIKWQEHYAYAMGLFQSSPIFESRDNADLRAAFVGEKTSGNAKYFDNFQDGLKNTPRLAVSGSDAHCFVGDTGNNDKRGYGDFPSNKKTWVKAEPSFRGLQQAILEPAKRSYIGEKPPKLYEIETNKTFYIDSLEVSRTGNKSEIGQWLGGCDIPLNPDLIAIIGNKGSGKSALADIIAMLGNSKQLNHFSFLKKGRFCGKSGEPANHFTGTLTWCDDSTESRKLNEQSPEERAEQVRYIPQGYFEELCNRHTSNESDAFEKELRSVIFSHTNEEIRLDTLDFEQLVDKQEQSLRNRIAEFRKNLSVTNEKIVRIEEQLQPIELKKLEELLLLKIKEIEEYQKLRPVDVAAPSEQLTKEEQEYSEQLSQINLDIDNLKNQKNEEHIKNIQRAKNKRAVENIREQLRLLEHAFLQAKQNLADDLQSLNIDWIDLVKVDISESILDEKQIEFEQQQQAFLLKQEEIDQYLIVKESTKNELTGKLNFPQQQYEKYQRDIFEWQKRLDKLIGASTEPETKLGLEARIEQIKGLPEELSELKEQRLVLTGEIFDILNEQRKAREALFSPVQELIENNDLIREDYQLKFLATLATSPEAISNRLSSFIKQNVGEFRDQGEGIGVVKQLFDNYALDTKEGVCNFVKQLVDKIEDASRGNNLDSVGIFNMLRKNQTAEDVYDLIFGLDFLNPKYSLLFQGAQIEQLSPGQRGALLLIFYLLVDKGKMPIILDQPEENLDNETVYRLLVPVLSEAKKKRQIIMVTHNPNLAVVCDAEQIIHAHFDRADNFKITYQSGSIENQQINERVITVLEGTKPAFNNRSGKYFS